MRLLVCGGRDYNDYDNVCRILDIFHKHCNFSILIHGAARGADTLADKWAQTRNIPIQPFPADWSIGKSAGYIRNKNMLETGKPELVIAFQGGNGTKMMKKLAENAGVKVISF